MAYIIVGLSMVKKSQIDFNAVYICRPMANIMYFSKVKENDESWWPLCDTVDKFYLDYEDITPATKIHLLFYSNGE